MGLIGLSSNSLAPPIGIQYRRNSSPIGVPGPTWVRRRFFSALSTPDLAATAVLADCYWNLATEQRPDPSGRAHKAQQSSNDAFPADRAAVHLVFEALHRRPRIMPGQPGARRPAPHDLVGEKRMQVVHGVDLRRRRISPPKAERREAALQLPQHVARLLAHRL